MISVQKQVSICALGTVFEWYDFSLFACLTPILSQIFFKNTDPLNGMLATFAIFASGFIMRPLGALFFGHLGDQHGRKYSLLITIFAMTLATTAIGLIPTEWEYATLFLVVCRLIQGCASSGEYPGVLTLLAEQKTLKRRSFVVSTGVAATGIGSLLGALTYVILLSALDVQSMLEWGWRIPFLIGAPLGIIGYFLRKYIFESDQFYKLQQQKLTSSMPIFELFSKHFKTLIALMSISILTNTLIYLNLIYFGNYAVSIDKLIPQQVIYITLIFSLIYSLSMLGFGFLADYVEKKRLFLGGYLLLVITAYPLFNMILLGNLWQQLLAQSFIALTLGGMVSAFAALLPEQFPTRVRYSGLSVVLNFSASFFGGSAPMICGWLTKTTHNQLAPLFYILFLCTLALYGIKFLIQKNSALFAKHISEESTLSCPKKY